MKRRHFLQRLLPLGLAATSLASLVARAAAVCTHTPGWLVGRLRTFYDPVLGKACRQPVGHGLARFDAICEEDFDNSFRALVVADYAASRIVAGGVDGWLLSETETIMYRAVFLADVRQAALPKP